jgi:hypothetical protein
VTILLVLLAAVVAAAITYGWLERMGSRAWPALVCRAIAWSALGILLVNLTCALPSSALVTPFVLLDASLSLGAAGGRWQEALDTARALGEVHPFGDEAAAADTGPVAGRSMLGPALTAAVASDRPIIVVTDGEVEDAADLDPGLVQRVGVRILPRRNTPDLAVTRVEGPTRATAGDTVTLNLDLRNAGDSARDTVTVELRADQRQLSRRLVRLPAGAIASLSLSFPTAGLPGGDYLLEARLLSAHDSEPRDDARLWPLKITPTPGVVVLASPADWDARFLYRTIGDVAQLPVRGYTRLEPGRWRATETLAPVPLEVVAQAASHADLLVIKGGATELARSSKARGLWLWPSGEGGETVIPADWYVSANEVSPVASSLVGLPVDSFPPLSAITPIEPAAGDWIALSVQDRRRGAERPVFIGRQVGRGRQVLTAADGLWRWSFRGGSSEQGYRSLIAATVSWLLASPDSAAGRALLVRAVVPNARPLVFQWSGRGAVTSLPVTFTAPGFERRDTLQFDGAGIARVRLPVGRYHYRLEGGGEGLAAVEEFSDEWLPRPVTLTERPATVAAQTSTTNARRWLWLFGICIAGFGGEWWTRRRLGLR